MHVAGMEKRVGKQMAPPALFDLQLPEAMTPLEAASEPSDFPVPWPWEHRVSLLLDLVVVHGRSVTPRAE